MEGEETEGDSAEGAGGAKEAKERMTAEEKRVERDVDSTHMLTLSIGTLLPISLS